MPNHYISKDQNNIISKSVFHRLAEIAGWNVNIPKSYFDIQRRESDVFENILYPQNYGFFVNVDWKPIEVLNGLNRCCDVKVHITDEDSGIMLRRDDNNKFVRLSETPDNLIIEILLSGAIEDKEFYGVYNNTPKEFRYVLVNSGLKGYYDDEPEFAYDDPVPDLSPLQVIPLNLG